MTREEIEAHVILKKLANEPIVYLVDIYSLENDESDEYLGTWVQAIYNNRVYELQPLVSHKRKGKPWTHWIDAGYNAKDLQAAIMQSGSFITTSEKKILNYTRYRAFSVRKILTTPPVPL